MSIADRIKGLLSRQKEQVDNAVAEAAGQMAIVEYPDGSTVLVPKEEAEK